MSKTISIHAIAFMMASTILMSYAGSYARGCLKLQKMYAMKHILLCVIGIMSACTALCRDIKGTVLDENNAPLAFANIVLYADSSYVAGCITDEAGMFSITLESDSALTAKVSFVGYDAVSVTVPSSGDMGTIILMPNAVLLSDVVVKSVRHATTLKGNALVTDVEGSPLSIAGTANDVLSQIPMLVDNGGAIEVFGKGVPAIYLNGRKVNNSQDLVQLSSRDIKTVEVITNPGVAYAADAQSVIRIRTKAPKGDGWSGTFRTDNGFQHYFRTGNSVDLKYRTHGLELFTNYGWWRGNSLFDRSNDMMTTTSEHTYNQLIHTSGKDSYNDMTGKIGFSWMTDNHSFGAYYQNSHNVHNLTGTMPSELSQDGALLDKYAINVEQESVALPRHYANFYYNGSIGKFGIDFNADVLWYKSRESAANDEQSMSGDGRMVATRTTTRSRMLAEKLVISYPIGKGGIEIGEEYTNSRNTNRFTTNFAEMGDADSRVDESSIASFVEFGQQIGMFNVGVGMRYEHVTFDYYANGQRMADRSRTYDNLFPSVSLGAEIGKVRMGLDYSCKTVRPGYGELDGTVSYINRMTYETGNPCLSPTRLQTVGLTASWRQFFAQMSYTHFKDGVYHVTKPYGDGEATLIQTENLASRHYFRAFAGGQFKVGAWQPKVNVGMMKQWLMLNVNSTPTAMDNPIFILQWQNAVGLPAGLWLNVDAQLMTRGYDRNMYLSNTPWHINAKLYKAFFKNTFSVTLEVKDIFDASGKDFVLCNDAVQIDQRDFSPSRSVMLTLQYRFNTTRSRYRGTGAGETEKARF